MLTVLAKILKVLNSEDKPWQIAAAVVLAAYMGLTPLGALHNAVLLLLVLWLRVNLTLFLVSFVLFTAIAFAVDPLSNQLGLLLLNAPALQALWTSLYDSTVWRALAYNNSLVLGSFALASLLSVPLFFSVVFVVRNYRERIQQKLQQSRFMHLVKGSKLFSIYNSLHG